MTTESVLKKQYDRSQFTLSNPGPWRTLERIKGPKFTAYRELLKRAESGAVLTDFPVEILVKTTLNCNHFCPKCLHGTGVFPAGVRYNMSFDTLKKVLDEGAAKGLQSIVFTGGEPTMQPEIKRFIEYAGSLGFPDISLITNGTRLDEEMVTCLVKSGVTRVNISLDSTTPETFAVVRGADHYDMVVNNIETFFRVRAALGSELPLLSLSFVLSAENQHELDPFLEKWKGRADGGIKIYPYKDVYSIVDADFSKTYGPGRKSLDQLDAKRLPVQVAKQVEIVSEYKIECMSPWYRCHVGINGELQACTTQGFCDHPQMVLGNIHESTFESVWKSDRWSELRSVVQEKRFDDNPVCKVCQRCV